jgi:hypothetical protein
LQDNGFLLRSIQGDKEVLLQWFKKRQAAVNRPLLHLSFCILPFDFSSLRLSA